MCWKLRTPNCRFLFNVYCIAKLDKCASARIEHALEQVRVKRVMLNRQHALSNNVCALLFDFDWRTERGSLFAGDGMHCADCAGSFWNTFFADVRCAEGINDAELFLCNFDMLHFCRLGRGVGKFFWL